MTAGGRDRFPSSSPAETFNAVVSIKLKEDRTQASSNEKYQKVVELALDLMDLTDDLVEREARVRQENVVACG